MDRTIFNGIAKLYDEKGTFVGRVIAMQRAIQIPDTSFGKYHLFFYSANTGKFLFAEEYSGSNKIRTTISGIKYTYVYKNELGQLYYIGSITKTLEIEL